MEALITDHLPIVGACVTMLLRRKVLPAFVMREDLEAAGRLGLVNAALRYDAAHGASFKTYAWLRVTGAVLDEIRRQLPLTRAEVAKVRRGERQPLYFTALDLLTDDNITLAAAADDPLDVFAQARLGRALQQLSPRAAKIIFLSYVDDLGDREIGERFGIGESRVNQIRHSALRRLRAFLEDVSHG